MKVECLKDKLRESINVAERVVGKNLALPILSSLLLEAKDNSLIIKATNLDIGLEIEVSAKIEEEGCVAISAGVISSFLNNLNKEDKVKIVDKNNNLHFSTKTSSTLIKCFIADDFPIIPRVTTDNPFYLNAKDLVLGIKSVIYSAALSDIKPEISSVYIHQNNKDLIFVSTDSFRLAEKVISLNKSNNDFLPVIIPFKNALEIVRVFDGKDGEVKIEANKNQISFYLDGFHLTSRVIDGIYPDYNQLMPVKFKTNITVSKDDLLNSLKISNIFADKLNQIKLKINIKDNSFEIDSKNQDIGENTIKVDSSLEGEDKEMTFNVKYILDCFQSLNTDQVILSFNEENRPMMIHTLNDNTFRYIIMPVNR